MKSTYLILILAFIGSSSAAYCASDNNSTFPVKETHQKKVKTWTKSVWSYIDTTSQENSPLFYPHNQLQDPGIDAMIGEFTEANLENQRKAMKQNLWNILRYHFFKSELTLYFTRNPEWYDYIDHGELLFPLTAKKYADKKDANYFNDKDFREMTKYSDLIGYEIFNEYPMALMSIDYPGEDSINADGDVVYAPNDYVFYRDKDIAKLKLREEWKMDETGEVLKKSIKAICPIMKKYDANSEKFIEVETFWVDYKAISGLLENYFYQLKPQGEDKKKIYSIKEYFEKRMFKNEVYEEEGIHVKAEEK